MRNTKTISILIIILVFITVWIQIPDIKDFLTKSKTITSDGEPFIKNEDLSAFPLLKTEELTSDTTKDTNLPGPLITSQKEDTELEDEKTTRTIKQPDYTATDIVIETNTYRSTNGRSILSKNKILSEMAEDKLNDMFFRNYFEHVSPQGVDIEDIASSHNYRYLVIGENLALGGFKSAEDVVLAWSKSEPHKKNMLDSRYTEIGIAMRRALFKGSPVTIIVQHFGKSTDSCPSISKQTKDNIDNMQEDLKNLKDRIEHLKKQIDQNDDESLIGEHNELVSEYNRKLIKLKKLVGEYNGEVEAFNACVEKSI